MVIVESRVIMRTGTHRHRSAELVQHRWRGGTAHVGPVHGGALEAKGRERGGRQEQQHSALPRVRPEVRVSRPFEHANEEVRSGAGTCAGSLRGARRQSALVGRGP